MHKKKKGLVCALVSFFTIISMFQLIFKNVRIRYQKN